jgi:catechol 2,3-dioxygenase-like lactoylglutathione lyase family enzyme
MLDHISVSVSNLGRARGFYVAALAPLGITVIMEVTPEESGSAGFIGFGAAGKPFFWLSLGAVAPHLHVAFAADSRGAVDAFYLAAMAAGGRDNGAPGLRRHYHANYYGAFVLDPDGYNIEAVCHKPDITRV